MIDKQFTDKEIQSMSPGEINRARRQGQLSALMGGTVAPTEAAIANTVARATEGGYLMGADLETLAAAGRHDLINSARRAGNLI